MNRSFFRFGIDMLFLVYVKNFQKKIQQNTYLIVAGHVEGHQPLQKDLGHFVVAEEGVSVDVVELTGLWHRAAGALQEVGAA